MDTCTAEIFFVSRVTKDSPQKRLNLVQLRSIWRYYKISKAPPLCSREIFTVSWIFNHISSEKLLDPERTRPSIAWPRRSLMSGLLTNDTEYFNTCEFRIRIYTHIRRSEYESIWIALSKYLASDSVNSRGVIWWGTYEIDNNRIEDK